MCRKEIELDYAQEQMRETYLDMSCQELREAIFNIQQADMNKHEKRARLAILEELLRDSCVDYDSYND